MKLTSQLFLWIFTLEMLISIYAEGPRVSGTSCPTPPIASENVMMSSAVFKAFRLYWILRLFRLARALQNFREMLTQIMNTTLEILNIGVPLSLTTFFDGTVVRTPAPRAS